MNSSDILPKARVKKVVKKKKKQPARRADPEIEEVDPSKPVVFGLREVQEAKAKQRQEQEDQ